MQTKKNVLLVGLDPRVVDYTSLPFDEQTLSAALKADEERINRLGYQGTWCLVDLGETAESVLRERLEANIYDCILVGAGIRTIPAHFLLFERVMNLVHALAPGAKLCFNTNPSDSAEAIQRWISP
jgi:hypothetical protein